MRSVLDPGFWPRCARCQGRVLWFETTTCPQERKALFRAGCHGDVVTFDLPYRDLVDGAVIVGAIDLFASTPALPGPDV